MEGCEQKEFSSTRKVSPFSTFSKKCHTWTGLESTLDFHNDRPVSNCLSHRMTSKRLHYRYFMLLLK